MAKNKAKKKVRKQVKKTTRKKTKKPTITVGKGMELVIAEKPSSALKIAKSLAQGKVEKKAEKKVPYYFLSRGNKAIAVCCAVGHLFGLAEKNKKKWTYPVFDVEWKPAYEVSKTAAFTKKYLEIIKKLAKDSNKFTVATDYDIEGTTIGRNIIQLLCKQKDANRMKFSTLTKGDLIAAYENKSKTLDWGQANAGETRHILDWYWGINISRALTLAVKSVKEGFKLLTAGRVQGPALKLIVDKEKEIRKFKPVPYWQLQLLGNKNKDEIEAYHVHNKFWDEKEVNKILKKISKEKNASVYEIEKKQFNQAPPVPFDLTTLQTEAYKCLRISPKNTLALAQTLYSNGHISYPRTSSQKLPAKLGFKNILKKLSKQPKYKSLTNELLMQKDLVPNEGKKIDDAHPAIFPTGEIPKKVTDYEAKLYDLIVKRFMAVFGRPAIRETIKVFLDVKKEHFVFSGTRTKVKGWHKFYQPYVMLDEVELPSFKKGETINVKEINKIAKETTPPKRYTESSIIRELEKFQLGTKSTRAQIVDNLFSRGYVKGKQIEATELGVKTIETLEKYVPLIVDPAMTRHFEEEMEDIRKNLRKEKVVLSEARNKLITVLKDFKKQEKKIGEKLGDAEAESYRIANTLGSCPNCKGDLMIKKSRFGRFVGCSNYPKCRTTFSLPKYGTIKPLRGECEKCSHPVIELQVPKRKKERVCINPKCITWTQEYKDKKKAEKELEAGPEE